MSFDDGVSRIGADPFSTSVADRAPARRLRGRLAAPVTVWTAFGSGGVPVGLTVSSVVVADGDPPEIFGLVDPLSDLWDALEESKRFVLHVLTAAQERTAERFALRFPGDPFDDEPWAPTTWGPALALTQTRASCSVGDATDAGYGRLVRAGIDEMQLDERALRPLVFYRGTYLIAGPGRDD